MSTIKITEQEKAQLRENAKSEVERLERLIANDRTVQILDAFKNKFNICETAYKVILAEHQRRKGNEPNQLKLYMTQVPHALSFAGYDFDRELLNDLFGSTSPKGMTAKKLRDAVTHGINQKAVDEITARNEELVTYMDTFLNVIKTFDNVAA